MEGGHGEIIAKRSQSAYLVCHEMRRNVWGFFCLFSFGLVWFGALKSVWSFQNLFTAPVGSCWWGRYPCTSWFPVGKVKCFTINFATLTFFWDKLLRTVQITTLFNAWWMLPQQTKQHDTAFPWQAYKSVVWLSYVDTTLIFSLPQFTVLGLMFSR